MGTTHSLRRHIAAIMEWPAVDKGLILLLTVIPLHLQFLSWSVYVLTRPDHDALVNVDYMLESMQVQIGLIFLGMVIAAGGFVLRRRSPDLLLYQHITLQFFAISLVLMGYTIGTNSFPAGIVMLGAPIFGFILPETAPAEALPVIERCRVALTEAGLLTDADEALYAAKAAGRNRIMQG